MIKKRPSFMLVLCLTTTIATGLISPDIIGTAYAQSGDITSELIDPMGDAPIDMAHNDIVLDELFISLKEVDDAGDVQRITAEIWSRWSTHPTEESLTRRLFRGVSMMNQGDYFHAEGIFSDIIDQDPSFAEAWNKRATLYYIQGRLADSRFDIAQTLNLEPRHFGALAGLGLIEMSAGNFEQALRAYEQAADVNPHMAQANQMIKSLTEKLRGIAL
jgi:tetratricopeptide (TPR) repeat protein